MLTRLSRMTVLLLIALLGIVGIASAQTTQTHLGTITAHDEGSLTLDHVLTFTIDNATDVIGEPAIGRRAFVEADTDRLASRITVRDGNVNAYFRVTGLVEAFDDDSIMVDGQTYWYSADTLIEGTLAVGEFVYLTAYRHDGQLYTLFVTVIDEDDDQNHTFSYRGRVTGIANSGISVDNRRFLVTDDTEISGNLELGALVYIIAQRNQDGYAVALHIHVYDDGNHDGFAYRGEVLRLGDAHMLVGNGDSRILFQFSAATQVEGDLMVGSLVYIRARVTDGAPVALYIKVIDMPEPPKFISDTGAVTGLTENTVTIDLSNAPEMTFGLTDDTEIFGDLSVGDRVYILAQLRQNRYVALVIYVIQEAPEEEYVRFRGYAENVSNTEFTVGDMTYAITDLTVIRGNLVEGAPVRGLGVILPNGNVVALFVQAFDFELQVRTVAGRIEGLSNLRIVIDGHHIELTEETTIIGEPEVGKYAFARVLVFPNGDLVGLTIKVVERDYDMIGIRGKVVRLTDDTVVVKNGDILYNVAINNNTIITGDLEVGSHVIIRALVTPNHQLIALTITVTDRDPDYFRLTGIVENLSETRITVNGRTVGITPHTRIVGDLEVGKEVFIFGVLRGNNDVPLAIRIEVLDDDGGVNAYVRTVGEISAVSTTSITVNTITFHITPNTRISGSPSVGDTVYVLGVPRGNGLVARVIRVLDEARTIGTVEALSADSITISGQTFNITDESELLGSVSIGDTATIGHNSARSGNALMIDAGNSVPTAVTFSSHSTNSSSLLFPMLALVTLLAVLSGAAIRRPN